MTHNKGTSEKSCKEYKFVYKYIYAHLLTNVTRLFFICFNLVRLNTF